MTDHPPAYDVTVDNGKYRFVYFQDGRPPQAWRNGERWPAFEENMLGSKSILVLVAEIDQMREFGAVQVAEHAFRAGYEAAVMPKNIGKGYYDAWSEYDPPEELKGGIL